MYSSKPIHKNKDAFTATGFTTVGDSYVRKREKNPRYGGKQFQTVPPKSTAGGAGLFQRAPYKGEPYKDKDGYLKQQPLGDRKLGFGTHDAKRRDEFTQHIAVERYRERLKSEQKFFMEGQAAEAAKGGGEDSVDAAEGAEARLESTQNPHVRTHRHLFDQVHDDNAPHRKVKDMKKEKHLGTMRTSAMDVGEDAEEELAKPQFGRVSVTKEFFDIGHMS